MAKKKKTIELSSKKIEFTQESRLYKVIRFYPSDMSIDAMVFDNDIKEGVKNIPFAHIPKSVKKLIKPN